ncbi:MAG TPA: peptidase S10 [Burkholderiaceae bacterium]|nr:peptidase S10 [Burkholderiaceae bacterium]
MILSTSLCRCALFGCIAALALQPTRADVSMDDKPASSSEKPASAEKPSGPMCPGDDPKAKEVPEPKPEQAVTHHRLTIAGSTIDYTASAGTLILRSAEDKPVASVGYIAYAQTDVHDQGRRPLTFAFNGGPGSSSIWLHIGALGPRRIVTVDAAPTPPAPYAVVDNEDSILDRTDLVMIDPVGTGISRAVCGHKDEEFWGVDADVDQISRFIAQYVTDQQRWRSPKFLLGESYGTTRAAGVVDALQERWSMAFNGVILVSVATDIEALFAVPGNDRPYPLYLPSYAAAAWYHHQIPGSRDLKSLLDDARAFAVGPYLSALTRGDALTDEERDQLASQLHDFTGLSPQYLKAAQFRVSESMFAKELLASKQLTVGRLDARFTGPTIDPLAKEMHYDPQGSAISAAFVAAFLDYYYRDLNAARERTYKPFNWEIEKHWKWEHKPPVGDYPQPFANTTPDLGHAMTLNPGLKALLLNGYFDLATPIFATEYTVAHLGLPASLRDHVQMKYYEAGHMMYINPPSLHQMKSDLAAFIDAASRHP